VYPPLILNSKIEETLDLFLESSFDLVIADPPYFRIVGEEWDRQWRTLENYLEWCQSWLPGISRVLRPGGTFYLFGYMKILAHLVPGLLKLGFDYREEITLDKGLAAVAGRATKGYKMFPNVTETILFLVKDPKPTLRSLLLEAARKKGLTAREINLALGVQSNGGGMWSLYTGDNILGQTPTREMWGRLCKVLGLDVPHERVSQTFHPSMGCTNVWRDFSFRVPDRTHRTQKPRALVERLLNASSCPGDLVLDAFSGSGVCTLAGQTLGRKMVAVEVNREMCLDLESKVLPV
jgi:site-specific DNA-methyltransferase (adenine-specific)